MRFLMRIELPTQQEKPAIGSPGFEDQLTRVYLAAGARSAYSNCVDGRRTDVIVIEVEDIRELTPRAKLIFEFLNVRPTILPETGNADHFGF
ncbi:MAG TPA: hypothetical protein VHC39_05750 [Rhizomicrobium sp.]|nr:hypothetical protein [Rhizomicrobium sp.]